jgi:hypothetical protein
MLGITYGCRRFIILMEAITEANPEPNENIHEANHSKSDSTCSDTHLPQSDYERVDSKDLDRDV